ncbi:hypothetical protein [Sulfuricurvum sp.]|uniref:hypothetical protein n=1 Tax=Sulfuricurvum sp. TaxID=2025608 RepID=UPI002630FD8C|nr:hypothetical protein [Sulfuricurvum sp.]MDD2782506.1 hypothetical protein [Sulfuricurvum sp.]
MKKILLGTVLTASTIFLLTGCGATTGMGVKNHNLLSVFNSNMDAEKTTGIIFDMSKYCSSGLLVAEKDNLKTLNTSVIDYKIKNSTGYYMHIEIEAIDQSHAKVSIYDYMNTEVTRKTAKTIENWVNGGSKTCEGAMI